MDGLTDNVKTVYGPPPPPKTHTLLGRCGEVENAELFEMHFLQKPTSGTNSYCFSVLQGNIDCLLLETNNDLSYQTNVCMFEAVQAYIKDSKRF